MQPNGSIILKHHQKGAMQWTTVENWEGGDCVAIRFVDIEYQKDVFSISDDKKIIQAGQYKLIVIDEDLLRQDYLAVRDRGLKTKVLVIAYKAKKLWQQVYPRLILTAWIWGLAEHYPGMIPTWQDLKPVKWILSK